MIFIFIGSTDLLSAEHTSRFIGPFLRWFAPDVSDATVASIQLVVRKLGHLTEYAILAWLLYRALREQREGGLVTALLALVIAASYAVLDEFHQSFVASRTGSRWDVLIDCTGALAGLVVSGLLIRRTPATIRNRKSKIEN